MIDFNIDNYLRISLTDVVLVCISTFLIVMFAKKILLGKITNINSKTTRFNSRKYRFFSSY